MNAFSEGSRRFSKLPRFTVWVLICALLLPAPVMTAGAVRAAPSGAESWNRHVHERLNSPERAAAVAKMHEEVAKGEEGERHARGERRGNDSPASPPSRSPLSTPHTGVSEGAALAGADAHSSVSPSFPAQAGNPDSSALADNEEKALDPPLRGGDGRKGGGDGKRSDGAGRKGFADASRPQSLTEVLFNYGAGFMGVPGLAPSLRHSRAGGNPDAYSLDEGLGFHQDGTARKAGGVAGASGPSDKGQRAREYMRSGLQNDYGPYASGLAEPGYDPATGMHWRGDPTRGGRVSASGSNGGGYSRELGDFDPLNMAIDKGLNWGAGFVNSMGEAAISGLVDGGRARLNFRLDKDGYFSGEGDALLPFYDGTHTTIYTQLGARSMHDSSDTRWIGNFGLGQRWFPFARGEDVKSADYDAGTLMLGYNVFFDYDLTRDHQRGGIGAEAQWDWFRLASNYYFPLSGWKGSEDFDSAFVEERAAEGWDARIKAYLPFYRNVALTGAYSQWFGDHVGMFGHDNLEKDPKVWSYGVEYTPIPLVSGFVTQKSTERGRTDTEFGLNFTYHFGMPWEEQTSHSKVAELRSVGGSRHEFVDRENKIILEYRAKDSYRIEYLGVAGTNAFRFRILDGFDKVKAGQTVTVTAGGGVTLAEAAMPEAGRTGPEQSFLARAGGALVDFFSVKAAHAAGNTRRYISDGKGEFVVRVLSTVSGRVTLTAQAGDNTQSFTLNVIANTGLSISTTPNLPDAALTEAYNQPLTASGGTEPYTFTLASGPLPDGLSLENGALTGTPTADGTFAFTVRVTDANGITADKAFSLTVNAAALSISTASPLPAATNGAAYSKSLSTSGGTGPYTFAVTDGVLPTGLDLSGSTISGTPTADGTFTFTVTVTDANNVTTEKAFSLTVAASYAISSVTPSPSSIKAYESTTFTATITKNGVQVPNGESVTWSVESGSGSFTGDSTSTTSGGTATITLQARAQGTVTVMASIGGATSTRSVEVSAADYTVSLTASPSSTTESGSSTLTAMVTRNGAAVTEESVTFSWVVKGTARQQDSVTVATGTGGVATTPLTGDGSLRTLTVTATLQSDTGKTATADVQFGAALPNGFIACAGLDSGSNMTRPVAESYCVSQGGKLPRINNRDQWDGSGEVSSIDGFGTVSWPSGLPGGIYWSGTLLVDGYGLHAWVVNGDGGIHVISKLRREAYRVVCVP